MQAIHAMFQINKNATSFDYIVFFRLFMQTY